MSEEIAPPPEGGQGADNANAQVSPPAPDNQSPPPPPDPFYKSLKNPELRGYAEVKGFKGDDPVAFAETVLDSYRQLEKLRGVPKERLLTLPENRSDPEAMKPILKELGFAAPEKAEDYGFVTMEGADPAFAKQAETWMFEEGVPAAMAKRLAERWNTFAAEQQSALLNEAKEEAAVEMGRVKAEWGAKAEENLEKARRTFRHLGFTQEHLEAIETATGAGDLWRLLSSAHDKLGLGEASFVEGEKKDQGFAVTPEAAKIKIEELKTNREWVQRYMDGDKAAAAEMQRLQQIAFPGMVPQ